jgi:uncharacterized protein YaiE (UPF0345 family)
MQKLILAAAILLSVTACNDNGGSTTTTDTPKKPDSATTNTTTMLSEAEQKEGWQLLFDGSSTKGWHKYGGAPVGAAWKAVDGTLHLAVSEKKDWQAQNGGDIVSDEEFENFHLKLEWKIDTCGNSGMMFYVNEDTSKYKYPWETGPEMQVLDNKCHPDAKIPKHRAGDLYDLISCSKETVKPALEWNLAEIKSVNGKLEFFLNGENVVTTQLWDDAWKKMVAGSKFSKMPGFGTYKKGRIALQDHGNNVWYRNVRIKRL